MALVDEIERILGPFYLPTHPSVAAVDSDDWEGAYTADYVVPEELKFRAELAQQAKRSPVVPVNVDKAVQAMTGPVDEYSKSKKEALTEALAFTHSRSTCVIRLIVQHR